MKKRRSGEQRHNWSRFKFRVTVDGRQQDAKSCTRCGMERTRDPGTKSLYLFRGKGTTEWRGFIAGVQPACEPSERSSYSMTLVEFEVRLRRQVESFFERWRRERAKKPEDWPLEQTSTERHGPVLKWEDQFRAWLGAEESESPEARREVSRGI